jgi:hypothetical protein
MGLARQAGAVWQRAEQEAISAAHNHGNAINTFDEEQQRIVDRLAIDIERRWSATVQKYGIDGPDLITQAREAVARHSTSLSQPSPH